MKKAIGLSIRRGSALRRRVRGAGLPGFAFAVVFGVLAISTACGTGSSKSTPTTIITTPSGLAITSGKSQSLSATGSDGSVVTWSLSGPGSLVNPQDPLGGLIGTTPAGAVTYVAPVVVTNTYAVVTVTSTSNSASTAYIPITVMPINVFGNVQPVSVEAGPSSQTYRNGAFTSVTVCLPGTVNCQTIDGILVDTGSAGLRVLASALPKLPVLQDSKGNSVSECLQFPNQSYLWGNVAVADIRMNAEVAGSVSIQSIADPVSGAIPSDCTSSGAGLDGDSLEALGANGILGLGLDPQDCGVACDPSAGGTPPGPAYYTCSGGTCSAAFVPLYQQVTQPVTKFPVDNNGEALQLGGLSGVSNTIAGSLTFGIGTQTNNALGTATVFTVDSNNNFTTDFAGQKLTASFIDSGLDALFFPDASLPVCPSPDASFFCPTTLTPLTAVNIGANKVQSTINFSVDNAADLFSTDPGDAAFSNLSGPAGTAACVNGAGACSFEWGLPFFYGRSVFVAINGQSAPPGINGQAPDVPNPPWWAYTTAFTK